MHDVPYVCIIMEVQGSTSEVKKRRHCANAIHMHQKWLRKKNENHSTDKNAYIWRSRNNSIDKYHVKVMSKAGPWHTPRAAIEGQVLTWGPKCLKMFNCPQLLVGGVGKFAKNAQLSSLKGDGTNHSTMEEAKFAKSVELSAKLLAPGPGAAPARYLL